MPYIEVLSRREDVEHVWVVAPRLAYSERAAMGWPTSWTTSTDKLGILIAPIDDDVKNILNKCRQGQSYCLFSGITAFAEVKHWLDLSLGYDVKRGIITEGPFVYNKPLWMHKLRFLIKDLRYVKYFDYVFAIGEDCEKYYRNWSKRWKIVPFMYCTEFTEIPIHREEQEPTELKVCFVGSIEPRKNVLELLKALKPIKVKPPRLTIVGDGPDRKSIEDFVETAEIGNCSFVGTKPMDEALAIIAENDVLVLPSLHDGWGAVINEAMTVGTVPVCSNRCGAKALIKASGYGGIFNVGEPETLTELINSLAMDVVNIRSRRQERVAWAKQHISPVAVAEKFIESLSI